MILPNEFWWVWQKESVNFRIKNKIITLLNLLDLGDLKVILKKPDKVFS